MLPSFELDMLFKNSPEKFWDLVASRYAASPISDRPAYETKIARIRALLTPEMSVLDIGCGTATQCADIARSVDRVTGIDISGKLLAIARQRMAQRRLDNVELLQIPVFDESLRPGSFDVVMAFFVLHFFADVDAAIARVHELLRPGGLFVSETGCLGDRSPFTGRLLRFAGRLGLLPAITVLTTRELEQSLANAGFDIVEKTRFGNRPDAEFTLIAKKV